MTVHLQKASCIVMGSYSNTSTKKNPMASQETMLYHFILMKVWMQVITVICTWGAIKMFMVMVSLFLLSRTVVY